ncbi:hypothetical protein B0H13DRAFT_1890151 [Mycena leptocephala]|nr:hypothetical protein B0H13DRAFT_1890151 [Mycena leptocephala]
MSQIEHSLLDTSGGTESTVQSDPISASQIQTGEHLDPANSEEFRLFLAQDSSFRIHYDYSARMSRRHLICAQIQEGLAYAAYFKYAYSTHSFPSLILMLVGCTRARRDLRGRVQNGPSGMRHRMTAVLMYRQLRKMSATPGNHLSNSELDKILMLTACSITMVGGCTPQPTARADNRHYFAAIIARYLTFAGLAWWEHIKVYPSMTYGQEWKERINSYIPASLHEMGLRIALGHGRASCPQPRPERIEAISIRGIITVAADFCTCANAASDADQIKEQGWGPMLSNFVMAIPVSDIWSFFVEEGHSGASSESEPNSDADTSDAATESSTSDKVHPGDSSEQPLVVDDQGHLTEVQLGPARRRGQRGIANHPVSVAYRPAIHLGTKGKNRQATPSLSPPASAVLSSPEVEITGSCRVGVDAMSALSSPEVTITGYRPALGSPICFPPRGRISLSSAATRICQSTVDSVGLHIRQVLALTHDSLWETDEHPPITSLCHGVKAHPVSCWTAINRKPYIHRAEEAGLRAAYPGWGANTSVSYSWKGLRFPKHHGIISPWTPSL